MHTAVLLSLLVFPPMEENFHDTAVYIQNLIGDKVSAHKLYFGMKPNLRHLRVFGSIAYVHVPKEKRRKLYVKAEK